MNSDWLFSQLSLFCSVKQGNILKNLMITSWQSKWCHSKEPLDCSATWQDCEYKNKTKSCYKTYCITTGDGQASNKLQYDLDSHMAGCWLSWCMHCLHQHYSHSLLHHTKIEFNFQIASFYDCKRMHRFQNFDSLWNVRYKLIGHFIIQIKLI